MGMQRNLSAVIAGRQNLIHDFHFIVMLAANINIRFTWRNSGCIFKLNVSEGKWKTTQIAIRRPEKKTHPYMQARVNTEREAIVVSESLKIQPRKGALKPKSSVWNAPRLTVAYQNGHHTEQAIAGKVMWLICGGSNSFFGLVKCVKRILFIWKSYLSNLAKNWK